MGPRGLITLVMSGLGGAQNFVLWGPFSDIRSSEIYLLPNEMLSTRQQHRWYILGKAINEVKIECAVFYRNKSTKGVSIHTKTSNGIQNTTIEISLHCKVTSKIIMQHYKYSSYNNN